MQRDSKDLHVQPKSGDDYAIIQGPACFATRNPMRVIYVDML